MSGVDDLAALIREVDGSHALGAGALAERLIERGVRCERIARHNDALAEAERQRDDALAKIARVEAVLAGRQVIADYANRQFDLGDPIPAVLTGDELRAALADPEPTP